MMTTDEQSNSIPEPCRSNAEIMEMITAAENLVLLSKARVWAFDPSVTTPIHNSNRSSAFTETKTSRGRTTKIKKVTFCLDVPESSASSRKRKTRNNDALDFESPAASCSNQVGDDLDDFKLPPEKKKFKRGVIRRQPVDQGPVPPPDMPRNVKSVVDDMGGTGVVLITQKRLTATDVKAHNNRLQIPFRQIVNHTFLTDQEKLHLSGRDENNGCNPIETLMLDPALNQHKIMLRRWLMAKDSSGSKSSENYVLNKPWKEIVEKNGLREGDAIQLWGFRVGVQLHLALLRL